MKYDKQYKLYLKKNGEEIDLNEDETYNLYLMLLSKYGPELPIKQEIGISTWALITKGEEE